VVEKTFKDNWNQSWNESRFKIQFVATFIMLGALLFFLSYFFAYVEAREGSVVNDVILNLVSPVDLSVATFLLIYFAAVFCIITLLNKPELFLKAVQAYFLVLIFRIITLTIFPLEPPEGIILLKDPFIEYFFYGQTRITKDLFFSGHVATVCLLYLANPIKKLNWFYLSVFILVALFIMIQRVHYSFDVLAAPVFAWLSWRLVNKDRAATKIFNNISKIFKNKM
jgi:membrane-associated phospholipid phosphatase